MQNGIESWCLPNGYLDMGKVLNLPYNFIFMLGGRGIGKTYGALNYCIDSGVGKSMLFLRISDKENDLLSDPDYSPFSWINNDRGFNILPFKKNKAFVNWYDSKITDEGKPQAVGDRIAQSTSLTTLNSIRGFNGSWINLIIFDEFIKQKRSSARIHDDDFKDVYETINRNRELMGEPPVKALLLSNSVSVDNHVMRSFHLVDAAMKMKAKGQIFKALPSKGIAIFILPETEIGRKKRDTALYRASGKDEYSEMALSNEFSYDKPTRIMSLNLKGYRPVFYFDSKIGCYEITNTKDYYVTSHLKSLPMPIYRDNPTDILRLRRDHYRVWNAYIRGEVIFETYATELEFRKLYLDRPWYK